MSDRDVAMRLLCRCAEVAPDDAELRATAAAVGDWDAAIELAVGHGIVALVGAALERAGVELPPAPAGRLAEHRRALRVRGMAAAAESVHVLRVLGEAGVAALPLKGPMLAVQAYGDSGVRDYGDVDVIVGSSNLAAARAALDASGYAPTRPWTDREQRWFIRTADQVVRLARPGSVLPVEVHGRVHPPFFQVRLERDLWRRRSPIALEGARVDAMSAEDTLLVACTHASRDEWRRLEAVATVAHLVPRSELDWPLVEHAARRAGALRMTGVGLRLARDVLHQPLPAGAERIAGDAAVVALARTLARDLLEGDPLRGDRQGFNPAMRRLHLELRERRRDRARYVGRLLVLPTLTEVNMVRLPRALEPLYSLLRLARLALAGPRRVLGGT